MLKKILFTLSIFLFMFFENGAHATYFEISNDPLHDYHNEIKQSEMRASQAILNTLKSTESDSLPLNEAQTPSQSSSKKPIPHSNHPNTDKAFTPAENISASATHPNKNPWLQPNPWAKSTPTIWEKNVKMNPYANIPVPGPLPSSKNTVPSPPNIFLPQVAPANNPSSNAND
ncbi:hypothetical protein [Rickettsiella grylli]|uniref:Uncharacterized protein n=1 Tax=Rickettsiella grylli TaxID=59196 RepID=A8PNT5_9COXI|nr:hypothetical protein [Rickettsiella grylli]EDP46572.1 hypothetical protein RICGR_1110 [Rickettsiella grylli]